MYKKVIDGIGFYFALSFIILSFFAHTFFNDEFTWRGMLNTDGLTLLGLLGAFLSMIVLKIPLLRRLIVSVLLKTNFLQLDYHITVNFKAAANENVEDLFLNFQEAIRSFQKFSSNDFSMNFSNHNKVKIFHRAIAGNVEIYKSSNDDEDEDCEDLTNWIIQIDGVSPYRVLERNINFLCNSYLELLSRRNVHSNKISITVSRRNSEYSLNNMGVLLSARKYNVNQAFVEITSNETTVITIDTNKGVAMTSRNKGDFLNSIEALKSVLIS
ncbi:hypothetical protein [Bacillus sp. CECT 9360]|uniref:hypothetical protein n=1 Tax=Bacillus sp. CECT 9360 TaxID=2845821 RepID=UPI001E61C7BD|nr:hypothetical protein [Bacillus sp. CECT 9360]CAH0346748.1 hypothetical protein BCI9360_03094 [Bacillus sp. CECT 9360]